MMPWGSTPSVQVLLQPGAHSLLTSVLLAPQDFNGMGHTRLLDCAGASTPSLTQYSSGTAREVLRSHLLGMGDGGGQPLIKGSFWAFRTRYCVNGMVHHSGFGRVTSLCLMMYTVPSLTAWGGTMIRTPYCK
ncbi:hypothetical protein NDU88_009241 [Pleurodeles waltl]|uniref:Uncharacterized protein n=1 Tax=Pleurodeles waltl TaxID=8319 RepID=A0AAV7QT05_PLEWA|nr:hypothetical protein NDU88_009241 [Pleurodeles waltl]